MTVYVNGKASDQLTTSTDVVTVTGNSADNVYGILSPNATDYQTFTPGDKITGNGKTALNLSVASWSGDFSMPGATMSGVKTLNITNLVNPGALSDISLDATLWGDSFKKFSVSGVQNANLIVNNLTVANGALVATASGNNQGVDIVSATMGDASVTFDVNNSTADSVAAKAVDNADKVMAKGGKGDSVIVTHAVSAATISETDLNKIRVITGEGGDSYANVDLDAYATNAATSIGNATVEKIVLEGGDSDARLHAHAKSTTSGNATAGNVAITDVTMSGTADASMAAIIDNAAEAGTGNATVGSISISDVNVALASGGGAGINAELAVSHFATAGKGNALVGDITVGGVTASLGDGQDLDIVVEQDATATTGNATLGKMSVGDVSIDATGTGDSTDSVYLQRAATVGKGSGNAVIGSTTVGSITADNDLQLSVEVSAAMNGASKGTAVIGDVTVGSVDAEGTSFEMDVEVETIGGSFSSDNAIGKVTVGDVSATAAVASYDTYIAAANGKVGDVDLGDVDLSATGVATISIDVSADATIGNVSVGSLSATGSTATLTVDVSGITADELTSIGNVTIDGASVDAKTVTNASIVVASGTGSIGTVSVGDFSVDVKASGTLDANSGITIGTTGSVSTVGAVSIGNVSLTGAAYADAKGSFEIDVTGDKLSTTALGDLSVTTAAKSDMYIDVQVDSHTTMGNVSGGDLTLSATGADSDADIKIAATATDSDAKVSLGDISLSATNIAAAYNAAIGTAKGAFAEVDSEGALVVGGVSISTNNATLGNVSQGTVDLDSSVASVTAGAIDLDAVGQGQSVLIVDAKTTASLGDTALLTTTNSTATVTVTAEDAITLGDLELIGGATSVTTVAATSSGAAAAVSAGDIYIESVASTTTSITLTGKGAATISTGDITAAGSTTLGVATQTVSLVNSTTGGIALVGDIKVIGGFAGDSIATLSVTEGSSWLKIDGDTTGAGDFTAVTVGDIDYRNYSKAATVTLWASTTDYWSGATDIYAGSGGLTVTGNQTVNTYHLGAGTDQIKYTAANFTSTGGVDSLLATYADQALDFNTGVDTIDVTVSTSLGEVDGGTVATYAAFLAAANTAIDGTTENVYFAKVTASGDNTYWVAVDANTDGAIDYVVQVDAVGVFTDANIV